MTSALASAAFGGTRCLGAVPAAPGTRIIVHPKSSQRLLSEQRQVVAARAEAGDVEAMDALGFSLLTTDGLPPPWSSWACPDKSSLWWKRAAALGDAKAMDLLGHLYAEPWGVPQDLKEAATWFERAADRGSVEGAQDVVLLYWGEWSDERDDAKAAIWLKRVDEMGGERPDDPREGLPFSYKDPRTNITLQVEADGRHVTATSPEGKILWRRNPFVDARMQPYRHARPIIRKLEPASEWASPHLPGKAVVGVLFSSSQFGVIDLAAGDFTYLGQD